MPGGSIRRSLNYIRIHSDRTHMRICGTVFVFIPANIFVSLHYVEEYAIHYFVLAFPFDHHMPPFDSG